MRGPMVRGLTAAFRQDEAGAGTVFALFGITVCLLLAGMAVDAGNAWRERELLRLSADVASHAGVGILAKGGNSAGAMVAATTAIQLNTPEKVYGRVLYDAVEDIRPFHYDFASNREQMSGPINAISVRLERNDRVKNPVPTFLLRLIGQENWDIAVESVAAVVPTERCQSSEGIFAHGEVSLNGESMLGKGVCVHSQQSVAIPQSVSFADGSGLSMPDMGECIGLCDDSSSPGFNAAAASVNLVMPKTQDFIQQIADAFGDPKKKSAEEVSFFAAHKLAADLSALEELGVQTKDLKTGDVVPLDAGLFQRARSLPAGLVYKVTCKPENGSTLQIGLSKEALAAVLMAPEETPIIDPTSPGTQDAAASSELIPHFVIDGSVLVSNCAFHFTPSAEVHDALMISTRAGMDAVLTAEEGAMVGDPDVACGGNRQAVIMALGAMAVPATFAASNAAFVIAGPVRVAGNPTGAAALHRGLAIHSGSDIQFAGAHAFEACDTGSTTLLPTLDVIKYVIPTEALVTQ